MVKPREGLFYWRHITKIKQAMLLQIDWLLLCLPYNVYQANEVSMCELDRRYEEACLTASVVYDRFEGEHKLRQYDEMIDAMEKRLEVIRENRREVINRYNLNKINECGEKQ